MADIQTGSASVTPQFQSAVETFGPRFMADLRLTALQVSGIFGNLAVESDQFRALQEYKPTVAGSRGGWGWPQWTGPRRRAFEAWADANRFARDNPEAFYRYMLVELRGPEAVALAKLRATSTLNRATEVFMLSYERPGVPHLETRQARALEAMHVLEVALVARQITAPAPLRPPFQSALEQTTPATAPTNAPSRPLSVPVVPAPAAPVDPDPEPAGFFAKLAWRLRRAYPQKDA